MYSYVRIDHTAFFNGYRKAFGKIKQSTVTGIELLGRHMEADPELTDIRWAAYMLATVKHECADTWTPLRERGPRSYFDKYEPGTPIGDRLGNKNKGDGWKYRGGGYAQITGLNNYAKLTKRLGLPADQNLIDHPENVLVPEISYRILSLGMREGLFTTKKLSDYILPNSSCDYLQARRVVNGVDQAEKIADYASEFEQILRASLLPIAKTTPEIVGSANVICYKQGDRVWMEISGS